MRRRFLFLRATRWLPTGLLVPVFVLLLLEREFSLGQIGAAFAVQGVVVLLLELPTGGLADSLGRRPVLWLATMVEVLAILIFLRADTMSWLILSFALLGVYRALESGPLDAWYVDAAQEQHADLDLEKDLSAAGVVTAISLAVGSLTAGALVALEPSFTDSALAAPVVVALGLRIVDAAAIAALMTETKRHPTGRRVADSFHDVPVVIADTWRLVKSSRVLAALVTVEFFWGLGMVAFESLGPVKLAEVTGDAARAASLFGPAVTVAWIAAAAGSALAPRLGRRFGSPVAAMGLQTVQALLVVALALTAGVAAVIAFYVVTIAVHGSINPLYQAMLHEQADAENRATVLSAASMAAHPGGAVGGIVLGSVAQQVSVTTAMILGAMALLAAVPFYLPAARRRARLG